MSSYTMSGPHVISIGDLNLDDAGWLDLGEPELPNRKFRINIHQAHGGHIVEICKESNSEGELYIISEEKDLGPEIGNIITHSILNAKHE